MREPLASILQNAGLGEVITAIMLTVTNDQNLVFELDISQHQYPNFEHIELQVTISNWKTGKRFARINVNEGNLFIDIETLRRQNLYRRRL